MSVFAAKNLSTVSAATFASQRSSESLDLLAMTVDYINLQSSSQAVNLNEPPMFSPNSYAQLEAALANNPLPPSVEDVHQVASPEMQRSAERTNRKTKSIRSRSSKPRSTKSRRKTTTSKSDQSAANSQKASKSLEKQTSSSEKSTSVRVCASRTLESLSAALQLADRVVVEWMDHAKQRERLDQIDDGGCDREDFVAVRAGVAKHLMMMNIERDLRKKHTDVRFSITRDELSQAIASCIATASDS